MAQNLDEGPAPWHTTAFLKADMARPCAARSLWRSGGLGASSSPPWLALNATILALLTTLKSAIFQRFNHQVSSAALRRAVARELDLAPPQLVSNGAKLLDCNVIRLPYYYMQPRPVRCAHSSFKMTLNLYEGTAPWPIPAFPEAWGAQYSPERSLGMFGASCSAGEPALDPPST